jgi:Bifunctional DNA primase/polymerase, N-terminal
MSNGTESQYNHIAHNGQKQQRSKADCLFDELGGSDLLDAGLQAAARGWKIFPCTTQKKPLVQWREAAATDPTTIIAWSKWQLVSMWARAFPPEVLVIDLDRKHGKDGVREFERLQGYHPDQFDAPRVITATAGVHVYTDPTGETSRIARARSLWASIQRRTAATASSQAGTGSTAGSQTQIHRCRRHLIG